MRNSQPEETRNDKNQYKKGTEVDSDEEDGKKRSETNEQKE